MAYRFLTPIVAPLLGLSGLEPGAHAGVGQASSALAIWGLRGAIFLVGGVVGWVLSPLVNRLLAGFFRGFNWFFDRLINAYGRTVALVLRLSVVVLMVYGGLLGLTYLGFTTVPTGFIPAQDKGYLIVDVQLPYGASLERTDAVVLRASEIILEMPGVANAVGIAGFSGATRANSSNAGAIFTILEPFEERKEHGPSAAEITQHLRQRLAGIQEARIAVFPPPPVQGLGTAGGFKLEVQDRSGAGLGALQSATEALVAAGNQQPGLVGLFTPFNANTPQLYADVDRTKATKLNVPLNNLFDTLQVYLGSSYVNDFNLFGRTYRVTAQAEGPFRNDPEEIAKLKTRSATGAMVPLGSLVEIRRTTGPDRVLRYNMFPAAEINGDTTPGVGSGQAIATMERLAAEVLPSGMGFEWTDLAYQQILAGNTALFIFPLCVLFVFLVLAAQYESWVLPLAIILIVPMCLLSAIAGVWLRGMDNNILTQIGFVVLVALACKNAILIVEFAKDEQASGQRPGRSGDRSLPHPPAADPHDLLRLHPWRAPAVCGDRGWRRDAARARDLGAQRHVGGDVLWVVSDAGVLRGHPLVRRTHGARSQKPSLESLSGRWQPSFWCHVSCSCPAACWSGRITQHRQRRCPRLRQSGAGRPVHGYGRDRMVARLSGRPAESVGRAGAGE